MAEKWAGLVPCVNEFERLASEDPQLLVDWVNDGGLKASELTFAAEALGKAPDAIATPCLLKLLVHTSPLVREGAVYGAVALIDDREGHDLVTKLREMALGDLQPSIREAAAEGLADLTM